MKGFDEAIALLKHLPETLQVKALNRVLLKAAAPVVREARKNVRPISRRLSMSVKAWQKKGRKSAVVFVGPKKQTLRDQDIRYAHLIENGSSGIISKQLGKGRIQRNDGKDKFRIIAAQAGVGGRYRKDQSAHPYMEPAWNNKVDEVRRIMNEDTTEILMKEIQKKAYKP